MFLCCCCLRNFTKIVLVKQRRRHQAVDVATVNETASLALAWLRKKKWEGGCVSREIVKRFEHLDKFLGSLCICHAGTRGHAARIEKGNAVLTLSACEGMNRWASHRIEEQAAGQKAARIRNSDARRHEAVPTWQRGGSHGGQLYSILYCL